MNVFFNTIFANIIVSIIVSIFSTFFIIVVYYLYNIIKRNNKFKNYTGPYYLYRWTSRTKERLLELEVKIVSTWLGKKKLEWQTINGYKSRYQLEETAFGIFGIQKDSKSGTYSLTVIHLAYSVPIDFLSGIYLFKNTKDEFVSGQMILSREKLTKQQVTKLMRYSLVISSQNKASLRYEDFIKTIKDNTLSV